MSPTVDASLRSNYEKILEFEKRLDDPNLTQDELDYYGNLLLDRQGLGGITKISGDVAWAVAAAQAEFLSRGLNVYEPRYEFANRVVSVDKDVQDDREIYLVTFLPRFVPIQNIKVTEDYEWNVKYWFFNVPTYRFQVDKESLSILRVDPLP
jgi:hypothetical protein